MTAAYTRCSGSAGVVNSIFEATYDRRMWGDDSELTAPAIVISSLGGLVYGKDILTPKDAYRARMLRKALKAPLGHPSGPRPRGQSCVENEFASEILHRRVLSPERGGSNTNTNSLCSPEDSSGLCALSSTNLRARINNRPPLNSTIEAKSSHKSGWKVQGQIAGEWRDRLGRHRRARPTENANRNAITASGSALAADVSMISSIPSSLCAESEVSFEGLVDELRERLPRASLLAGFVAAQRQHGHQMCPGVEAMVTGTMTSIDERQEGTLRKNNKGERGGSVVGGNTGRTAQPTTRSTPEGRNWKSSSPAQQRGEESRGLMPPGCLRLRHPMTGALRAHTNSQPLMRQNNQRLNNTAGAGPQPTLVLPPGGMLFSDGSAYRLVTTDAADAENASPSAAMVAAAKSQERALPLLQVCAVRVDERVKEAAGGSSSASLLKPNNSDF